MKFDTHYESKLSTQKFEITDLIYYTARNRNVTDSVTYISWHFAKSR